MEQQITFDGAATSAPSKPGVRTESLLPVQGVGPLLSVGGLQARLGDRSDHRRKYFYRYHTLWPPARRRVFSTSGRSEFADCEENQLRKPRTTVVYVRAFLTRFSLLVRVVSWAWSMCWSGLLVYVVIFYLKLYCLNSGSLINVVNKSSFKTSGAIQILPTPFIKDSEKVKFYRTYILNPGIW